LLSCKDDSSKNGDNVYIVQPTRKPHNVYIIQEEYKEVKYKNFRTNLNSLPKALKKLNDRAIFDTAAVGHNWRVHPINRNPPGFSYPH
jgi:hypothetical protein